MGAGAGGRAGSGSVLSEVVSELGVSGGSPL